MLAGFPFCIAMIIKVIVLGLPDDLFIFVIKVCKRKGHVQRFPHRKVYKLSVSRLLYLLDIFDRSAAGQVSLYTIFMTKLRQKRIAMEWKEADAKSEQSSLDTPKSVHLQLPSRNHKPILTIPPFKFKLCKSPSLYHFQEISVFFLKVFIVAPFNSMKLPWHPLKLHDLRTELI